jgi:leader peptidase (prepilin peptidase)/N-methyltransferase
VRIFVAGASGVIGRHLVPLWAAVIGLYFGWLGWSAVATGTLLAFAAAAVAVLALRPATFRRGRLVVPMAPFISAGALVAVLVAR